MPSPSRSNVAVTNQDPSLDCTDTTIASTRLGCTEGRTPACSGACPSRATSCDKHHYPACSGLCSLTIFASCRRAPMGSNGQEIKYMIFDVVQAAPAWPTCRRGSHPLLCFAGLEQRPVSCDLAPPWGPMGAPWGLWGPHGAPWGFEKRKKVRSCGPSPPPGLTPWTRLHIYSAPLTVH